LAVFVSVMCQVNTGCAECNDNPEIQNFMAMCWQDNGKWCNCSTFTPATSCGACYDMWGQDPDASCTEGLYCSGSMHPCIGEYYATCYTTNSNCWCIAGKINCPPPVDDESVINLDEVQPNAE